MHGNVWEWCQDWSDRNYYRVSPAEDPPGPERGSMRVSRGGGWDSVPLNCRSADRNEYKSNQRYDDHGFRVVLEVRPKSNSQ
jgi:formylglycine-generating enzyme required for sulfatase activity